MRIENEEDMQNLAKKFVDKLKRHKDGTTVIALYGDLGVGKTVFARAVLRALGIKEKVTSPTFVIQKEYRLNNKNWSKVLHIDAYRLESVSEMGVLNWEGSVNDKNNLILVEWAGNIESVLPKSNIIKIAFEYTDCLLSKCSVFFIIL